MKSGAKSQDMCSTSTSANLISLTLFSCKFYQMPQAIKTLNQFLPFFDVASIARFTKYMTGNRRFDRSFFER